MARKAIICLLALVFLAATVFTGCTSTNTGETTGTTATEENAEATGAVADETSDETTAEPTSVAGSGVTIGFMCGNQTMDFFLKMQKGVEDAVADGDKIITYSFDDDATKQSQIFDDLIVQKVDVIITTILDAESVYASLVKCQQAGIPVILLDAYPDGEDYQDLFVCAVVDDLYNAGYQHGKALCEAIGGEGELCYIWIAGLSEAMNQRIYGFEAAVAEYPDVELVGYTEISGVDMETALNAISAQLQNYPDMDGYFASWANAGLAAVSALAAADMGDVKLAISDLDATLAQYIVDGKAIACMDLNSYGMGQQAVGLAYQYLSGETIPEKEYKTQTIMVDESNVADYLE
jgi:ABC-type sugar transport system substrate-binding protein